MNRMEDLINAAKLNELWGRKEKEDCKKEGHTALIVLAVIGAVAAVAAIAYGVYRFFTPDYLDDFEDDLEDDFDEDFFDDDEDEEKNQCAGSILIR